MGDDTSASIRRGPGLDEFELELPHRVAVANNGVATADDEITATSGSPRQEKALESPDNGQARRAMGMDELTATFNAEAAVGPLPDPEVGSWLRRMLKLGPTEADIARRDSRYELEREAALREAVLRWQFDDAVTVTVVSPKGSAGKTPTARGLGAALGHARGGGVVVADLNELRGTLGLRSHRTHAGHIGHLASSAERLLSAEARSVDVEVCMNRQPDSYEWVLASDPTTTVPMSEEVFSRVHAILTRFYPLLVIDTGNAELASSWQAAVKRADVLVVPMKWRSDYVQPAAHMLEDLQRRGHEVLNRTVIVGTNAQDECDPAAREAAFAYFERFPIVEIPVDAGLDRPIISWVYLRRETQVAFEKLGATVFNLAKGNR